MKVFQQNQIGRGGFFFQTPEKGIGFPLSLHLHGFGEGFDKLP